MIIDTNQSNPLSIKDIMTELPNKLRLDLYLSHFEIDPQLVKNDSNITKILNYGVKAAQFFSEPMLN